MSVFPKVVVEQAHSSAWALRRDTAATMNPANPADSSLEKAADSLRAKGFDVIGHESGTLDASALDGADVLVIDHPSDAQAEKVTGDLPPVLATSEIDTIVDFVEQGGGLVVLAECDQDTYGNNVQELLARFGLHVTSTTVHESLEGGRRFHNNATWVLAEVEGGLGQGLLAGVDELCFYRAGIIDISGAPAAQVLARTSGTAYPAREPLAVALPYGAGRVVVLADSDLVGDDSIDELDHRRFWTNLVTWAAAARKPAATVTSIGSGVERSPEWRALKEAVEELRLMQVKDGSIPSTSSGSAEGDHARAVGDHARAVGDHARAAELVEQMKTQIAALAPRFPHDADYLAELPVDLDKWVESGFAKPDFLDSLMKFRPDLCREDGIEHLVVFPMYTQNGNLDRVFEALLLSVQWPDWLAKVEETYDNKMFLASTSSTSRPATTPTPRCCSRRPLRCARFRSSAGARSSAIVKVLASVGSSRRPPSCCPCNCRRTPSGWSPRRSWRSRPSRCGT